jgi:hypothetical protein
MDSSGYLSCHSGLGLHEWFDTRTKLLQSDSVKQFTHKMLPIFGSIQVPLLFEVYPVSQRHPDLFPYLYGLPLEPHDDCDDTDSDSPAQKRVKPKIKLVSNFMI